jgi:hypothetical protein
VTTTLKWMAAALVLTSVGLSAQVKMPDPKEISGVPLPAADVPAGTLSVRVVRGGFDKNLPDVPVEFVINGKSRTIKTDPDGRAQVAALSAGTHVQARVAVDGERLESQDVVIGGSGIRIVLVATDPLATAREAENRALAASPAEKGIVALGPETRVIVE